MSDPFGVRIASYWGSMVKAYNGAKAGKKRTTFVADLANVGNTINIVGGQFSDPYTAVRKAIQNTWFYSGLKYTSYALGGMSDIEAVIKAPGQEDEIIENHPFELVVEHPNPSMGKTFMMIYTGMWLGLLGKAFWFLSPDESGELCEIWPLPADSVTVVPETDGEGGFIKWYELQISGKIYRIKPEYICFFKKPNPFNMFDGLADLIAVQLPIDASNAAEAWNAAFFTENNVMPSVIINITPDENSEIEDADIEAMKADLATGYIAFQRKTLFTTAKDIQVNPIGWSQRDMDFHEGQQKAKEQIWIGQGIPPGLLEKNVTEASAGVSERVFKEDTLWPIMRLMSEQMTIYIVPVFYKDEPNLSLRFKDIRATRLLVDQSELDNAKGVLTVNEARQKFYSLPKIKGGDQLYTGQAINGIGDQPTKIETPAELKPQEMNVSKPKVAPPELPPLKEGKTVPKESFDLLSKMTNEALQIAITEDIKKWKQKAVKAFKAHEIDRLTFESSWLLPETILFATEQLKTAKSLDDINKIFANLQ